MTRIVPQEDETPMQALLRVQGEPGHVFEWVENDFVPCSTEMASDGLRKAMQHAREQGWIPSEDPGCECLTCRMFRDYTGEVA